jgi:hypothetical protein
MTQNDEQKQITLKDELTEFLLYTTPAGKIKVEIFFHDENVWLTQKRMAELFGVDIRTISEHLQNIFKSYELSEDTVIRKFRTTAADGKSYETQFYSLDAIISVWYRVNSSQATQFRIWATERLKEYIIKGFTMDDERLKNGKYFGKDYFEELLERIRSIRTSERRIYQQITDIFAECSMDYDPRSEITKNFYAMVQNKFHYAITGKTAAEIVYESADKNKPFMGLKTWKNGPKWRIIKSDTIIAKNYLEEPQIKELERTISSYFDYIERLVRSRKTLTMESLAESVNKFLDFNEYTILDGKWVVSHSQAEKHAHDEYEEYNKTQVIESDFDRLVKSLPNKDI